MNAPLCLVLEDVHKSFDKREVLKGIDLSVAEHEVVCLIGASGSGKSTLLRCINLIEPIDAGSSSGVKRSRAAGSTSTRSAAGSGSSSSPSTCSRT
jgi:ABC-type polar amino acid transport system ATPase subunit